MRPAARSDAQIPGETVVWHDLECSYEADLALWSELSERYGRRVLDLGCGTGRVAVYLAVHGCEVTALDHDAELMQALRECARRRGLSIETVEADAADYSIDKVFDLVLAPMQLMQVLAGPRQRARALEHARAVLRRGGGFAAALADPPPTSADARPPLPDMCEHDGWVYSSLPVAVRDDGARFAIDRLRQVVSPDGQITQSQVTIGLDCVSPDELEQDATGLGFRVRPRRHIPATEAHVSSTACVLEAL